MERRAAGGILPASAAKGGPLDVAGLWLELVLEVRSWASALTLTDPPLRRALAQRWVWENRDDPALAHGPKDVLVDALAPPELRHLLATVPARNADPAGWALVRRPLWPRYARDTLRFFESSWGPFSLGHWAAGSLPQRLPLGYEGVVFTYAGGNGAGGNGDGAGPGSKRPRTVLLNFAKDGWRVASLSATLPEPGWPPVVPIDR